MFLVISFIVTVCFLFGSFFLTALSSAFRRIHHSKKQFLAAGKYFFYRPFHLYFFPTHEYEGLFFATVCAQNVTRFCYAASSMIFLLNTPLFQNNIIYGASSQLIYDFSWFWICLGFISFLLLSFIVGEYLPRILGMLMPEKVFKFFSPLSSFFMFLVFPITFLFLKLSQTFSRTVYFEHMHEPMTEAKQEIIEIIQKAPLSQEMNPHDKKLIESVLSFRERIAREVMVPRVDVFSLSVDTSIKEAVRLLASEGFSRIPVYQNTVDNVVGVLMYKDLLAKYREYEEKNNDSKILEAPIETIQKNVLYTPETKKISNLLQEFRKKQVHLAIVVDEYGGTEGIVTIEDILEEIVGDIADEYDQEEQLFVAQPDGSWIVDARMSIFDVEEQLKINISQEGDFDTIGGFVFHQAGSIPSKGFIIHQENFEMEIIDSNERSIEKVRIKPIRHHEENEPLEPQNH